MITREERHSTRGRARPLQEMVRATGPIEDRWRSEKVKDMLDESSFEASPGHVVPDPVGRVARRLVGRMRDRAADKHP
jgi:pyruvate dehydrogenase (quinone)/pyruvate oxidase